MRVSGIEGIMPTEVKEGVELPKFIRTLTIETAEEEQQLRLFLTGALKVDERGCHALGRDFGSNALTQNPDVSNGKYALETNTDASDGSMPLSNDSSNGTGLKFDYSLDEKLRIIDTLTAAIQRNEPMMYPHTEEAETKLLALVQSI
ncbi:hypothetical protein [Acinetobacter sp. ANC 5414]|uniref:hypothetical protein n=1 Tax=Acinetobacter sp. ANC 5414 TaxID=2731251 RepID=UPI00148F5597|nr:hypothetical protein [Acinetobacter sp. ANC 5414]NNH01628.1 hypothetical protein [Acinetobacter sp. ANC 5414]